MPRDRFVLILAIVILSAGVTVWIGTLVAGSVQVPTRGWYALVPAVMVAYVVWRVIADRLGNPGNDRYDRID